MHFYLIPAVVAALLAFPSLAQEYQAVIAEDAVVRNAPGPGYGEQGVIPSGTPVAVPVCFSRGAYCKVHWDSTSGFVSGSVLAIQGTGQTVSEAEAERWAAIDARPKSRMPTFGLILTPDIRLEGDSFVGGAYDAGLYASLKKLTGRQVEKTGLGGSTMEEIVARVADPAFDRLLGRVTVFWDGSENGLTTVDDYLAQLQTAIDFLGHDRFIVLGAATNYREDDMDTVEAINAGMQARWPDNFLDWREILPLTEPDGSLTEPMFANLPTDGTHLSAGAMDLVGSAVLDFIDAKGW